MPLSMGDAVPGKKESTVVPSATPAAVPDPGLAVRAWRKLCREPSLMVTTAYVMLSFFGIWASFWFYHGFDLPILAYMQASDYLVAGLRDPAHALVVGGMLALTVLLGWPDLWRRENPERAEELRSRRWWWRLVFPNARWMRWDSVPLRPHTALTLAAIWLALWMTTLYVQQRAGMIREDRAGPAVQVTMLGAAAPEPGTARLLGTSNTYAFLWWPADRRAEAVPLTAIARIRVAPPAAPTRADAPARASARETPPPG